MDLASEKNWLGKERRGVLLIKYVLSSDLSPLSRFALRLAFGLYLKSFASLFFAGVRRSFE